MPTIKQLPSATSVNATDVLPISQGGTTKALSVAQLLSSTQAALALASGKLLGRVSPAAGGPEPLAVGVGLSLDGSGLSATGADHVSLPVAPALGAADEVVVNSGGVPARLPATALRGLFTAGSGVLISGGTISAVVQGYSLPAATSMSLGGVKVDGSSIVIDGAGVISAVAPSSVLLTNRDAGGKMVSVSMKADGSGNGVIAAADVLFQVSGAVRVNGVPVLSSAALPAAGGLLATAGVAGTVQAATAAQFEALLTAWLQSKATAPSATPGWWNNSGNPTYS